MPKELIHFKIAQRTAALLNETRFGPSLAAHQQGLLLGSVFHDALFYGVTPSARPLEKLTHKLHGADGQDTFTLLRLQTLHAAEAHDKGFPAALLVGMASHVFTDIIMHPMVWHLSGNYYATEANERFHVRQRHRALESLMDMVACPEMLGRTRYSIRLMLKHVNTEIETGVPLKGLAELAGISQKKAQTGLRSAWNTFAIIQHLSSMRPLASTLFTFLPWLPKPAAEFATLFYAPQLMLQAHALSGDIQFKHPVTGEDETTTLENLIDMAATKASELCQTLEPAVFDNASINLPMDGPSMDSGLSGVSTQQMNYYATTLFPNLS